MTRDVGARGRFTGRHMTLVMVAFFGMVLGVNGLLARFAVSTFSGVVVENSYVASQGFNQLLGAARADQALGWKLDLARVGDGGVRFTLTDAHGVPLRGAAVRAQADHPLGAKVPSVMLAPQEIAPGVYAAPLAGGRWHVAVEVRRGSQVWHAESDAL
jgi:nitrogen fixation protein FixH